MKKYTYRYTDECESYDLQDGAVFNAPLTDEELEAAILADCKDYDTNGLQITLHVYEMVWETQDPDADDVDDDDWDDEIERPHVILPGLDVATVDHVHVYEICGSDTGDVWTLVIAEDLESAEKYAEKTYPGEEYEVWGTDRDGDILPGMGSGTPIVDRDGDVIATR